MSASDFSAFEKRGGKIHLGAMDGMGIICLTSKDNSQNQAAIDIGTMLHATQAKLDVHGIDDLVTHFDAIRAHIMHTFPQGIEKAVPLRAENISGRTMDHWCRRVP